MGDGFRMVQVHYIYCELHLYFYYVSSTSDQEALDPRGWGPMPWGAAVTSHSSLWMATAGLKPATSQLPDFLIIILLLPVQRT